MNALTRFERLDDLFPDLMRYFSRRHPLASTDAPGDIRLDVSETDKSYEVRAEMPGAKKEDIRVAIDGNVVCISTEVKHESEHNKGGKDDRALIKELFYGSASRSFSLAHEVDNKAAIAKFENGILKLSLPKKQEASSRLLNIQ